MRTLGMHQQVHRLAHELAVEAWLRCAHRAGGGTGATMAVAAARMPHGRAWRPAHAL